MEHQRSVSLVECNSVLRQHHAVTPVKGPKTKRRLNKSAAKSRPAFSDIKQQQLEQEAAPKPDLENKFNQRVKGDLGMEPSKSMDHSHKTAQRERSSPFINVNSIPSIFNEEHRRSRTASMKSPTKLSKSAVVTQSPVYSMPGNVKEKLLVRAFRTHRRFNSAKSKSSHFSSASTRTNTSTTQRGNTLNTGLGISKADVSFQDDKEFKRKMQAQRAKSKGILNSIEDLKDCLKEIDGPCLLRDRLSTKQYNRMVDRVMERKAPQIKQDCIAMSEYISSLGHTKIWKFQTPSFSKRTEKLINSLPSKRY